MSIFATLRAIRSGANRLKIKSVGLKLTALTRLTGLLPQSKLPSSAPVAQMDRAFASGAKGRRFESCQAYQFSLNAHIPPSGM